MSPMEPGDRDRRVTIQALEDGADGGYPVETWVDLDVVWMQRSDARGVERFRAGQLSSPYETRWQMSWRNDMDPDVIDVMKRRRLVFRGRVHDITAAMEIGRREGIELFTVAKGSDETV